MGWTKERRDGGEESVSVELCFPSEAKGSEACWLACALVGTNAGGQLRWSSMMSAKNERRRPSSYR